jgi:hypothetical protein
MGKLGYAAVICRFFFVWLRVGIGRQAGARGAAVRGRHERGTEKAGFEGEKGGALISPSVKEEREREGGEGGNTPRYLLLHHLKPAALLTPLKPDSITGIDARPPT